VHTDTGVVAIDFEGDPTLPTAARRRPASPLQDLASLLLSLDHVAAAAARRRGFGSATYEAFAWSAQARGAVLAGYANTAPPGPPPDPDLLRAVEVAREWREAVYAARVLPEWLYAPRLVLHRLLA
jgi:maltokinase